MNRTEFIAATAIILFVAFLLGWFASWLYHRLTQVTQADMDQALAWIENREGEMQGRLKQAEAELRAAMDGLRDARHEAADLRKYIEELNR